MTSPCAVENRRRHQRRDILQAARRVGADRRHVAKGPPLAAHAAEQRLAGRPGLLVASRRRRCASASTRQRPSSLQRSIAAASRPTIFTAARAACSGKSCVLAALWNTPSTVSSHCSSDASSTVPPSGASDAGVRLLARRDRALGQAFEDQLLLFRRVDAHRVAAELHEHRRRAPASTRPARAIGSAPRRTGSDAAEVRDPHLAAVGRRHLDVRPRDLDVVDRRQDDRGRRASDRAAPPAPARPRAAGRFPAPRPAPRPGLAAAGGRRKSEKLAGNPPAHHPFARRRSPNRKPGWRRRSRRRAASTSRRSRT